MPVGSLATESLSPNCSYIEGPHQQTISLSTAQVCSPDFSFLDDDDLTVFTEIIDDEFETIQGPHEQVIQDSVATEPAQINHNVTVNPDVEGLAPPSPKRRKKRSKVWDYFTLVKGTDGKESVICKHCNKKYARSSKGETSNMSKHIDKCSGRRNGGEDKPAGTRGISSSKGIVSDQELNGLIMARKIIENGYPWSMVEQDLLGSNLQPPFEPQSQNTLKADILHVYRGEKEKLYISLGNPSCHFNLTINLFRHDIKTVHCYLTLHFINENWELKKKILAFKQLDFWNSCWDLFIAFRSMLIDWKISKNICTITAQNTKEDDQIFEDMKMWLAQEYALPFRAGCFAHILDLLIEDGFQQVKDVFHKMMSCVSYVRSTSDNYGRFQSTLQELRSRGKEVTFEDIPKSWGFSIRLLEKVLVLREAFDLLPVFDSKFSLNPLVEEWDEATLICKCLKVIDDAVQWNSGRGCLTTNLYFPQACKLYKRLCEWNRSSNPKVRLMASKMKTKFEVYWHNSDLVLAIAAILDPRFKFDIVELWYKEIYGEDHEKHSARIHDVLTEVYSKYTRRSNNSASSSSVSSDATCSKSYDDTGDMLDALGMPCTCSGHDDDGKSQKSELERYLEEPKFRLVKEFDILDWWRVNSMNFPTVAKLARDFLAIPMSAALSNPTFNNDIMKIDQVSSNIHPVIIEALICAKDWCANA